MQANFKNSFTIYYLSEQAVTIEFGDVISEDLLQQISSFNELIGQNPFPGFRASVPAYTTISIFFDAVEVIDAPGLPGADCFEKVSVYLKNLQEQSYNSTHTQSNIVTIPVCYGSEFGPDIDELARLHKLSVSEVIDLHSSATYKVYMIGFVPGFAYLGGMNDLLETPRKSAPRKAVPAGSVGIAGKQTGVYPLETPGGWQLIGKTPLTLFDAHRPQPSLLKAGGEVVFKPIDQHEFDYIANNQYADTHQ